MTDSKFLVRECDMRPATPARECFYCKQDIGQPHLPKCVLIKKKVRMRAIIEYEVDMPNDWDKDQIEFHRNDGSWCADNFVEELIRIRDENESEGCCMCEGCSPRTSARFEYIEDESGPFLEPDDEDES